jgi:hypothetical protein
MTEPRLKAGIWVKALMRRAWALDVPAFLMRRGDEGAGAVLIRMNGGPATGTVIYARGLLSDGNWGWRRASGKTAVTDAEADAYVERQTRFDDDLWVIEIEAPDLGRFVDDPVEN